MLAKLIDFQSFVDAPSTPWHSKYLFSSTNQAGLRYISCKSSGMLVCYPTNHCKSFYAIIKVNQRVKCCTILGIILFMQLPYHIKIVKSSSFIDASAHLLDASAHLFRISARASVGDSVPKHQLTVFVNLHIPLFRIKSLGCSSSSYSYVPLSSHSNFLNCSRKRLCKYSTG